jgi:hypothetical protein
MAYNWIIQTDPGARSHFTENNATLTRHRAVSAHTIFNLAPILAFTMTPLHAHRDMSDITHSVEYSPPSWESDSRSDAQNIPTILWSFNVH